MKTKSSLFDFYSVHEALAYLIERQKSKDVNFGLRNLAKLLNLSNHTPLSLYLANKRKLPSKYVPRLKEIFDLTVVEGEYLLSLIDLEKAKSPELRQVYLSKLKGESLIYQYRHNYFKQHQIYQRPLGQILLAMFAHFEELEGIENLRQRFLFKLSREELLYHLNLFKELEMIEEIGQEKWRVRPGMKNRYIDQNIFPDEDKQMIVELIINDQINHLRLGKEVCLKYPDKRRFLAGMTIAIEPARVNQVRDEFEAFITRIKAKYELQENKMGILYQIDTHFYPYTH